MWIEYKGDGIIGPARIGWVKVSDKGKRIDYGNQSFRRIRGGGFKSNYYDTDTHEEYWISGCHTDGRDALYPTKVEIDEDALDEYWVNIRRQPSKRSLKCYTALSKY
jgi:hypothetical protein